MSRLHFTVDLEPPLDGATQRRRFRVSLPHSAKWERARVGEVLQLLCANTAGGGGSAAEGEEKHLATWRGPIGNHELLCEHVCPGDELRLCSGEPSTRERTSLWMWGACGPLATVPALHGVEIRSVALGNAHAAVVTAAGLVLTWGENGCGQLGTGDEEPHAMPRVVRGLARSAALVVACGPRYTAVITEAAELYTWGQHQPSNAPVRFVSSWLNRLAGTRCGVGVAQVACGGSHMLALHADGDVFAWGYNEDGQCGVAPHASLQKPGVPLVLPFDAGRPLLVAAGASHSLVLTEGGCVFGFGANSHGQLGLPTRTARVQPTRVARGERSAVADVVAAGHASLLRLADGRALLLGKLEGGGSAIRLDSLATRSADGGAHDGGGGDADAEGGDAGLDMLATRLPVGTDVRAMCMSEAHALLLVRDGRVRGFGYNRYSQASPQPPPRPAPQSTFVQPHEAAEGMSGAGAFDWEDVLALAAGGGQSAVLTRERHSLRERCESALVAQLEAKTCAALLDAALHTHAPTLLAQALSCVKQCGIETVVACTEPAASEPEKLRVRLEQCVADARALAVSDSASRAGTGGNLGRGTIAAADVTLRDE
jgi:alpha-tubulin suppressor-like RCC1 family protein